MVALHTSGNAQTKVIHFWNFNSYTSGYTVHLPGYANIGASYSTIDTNKARWVFKPLPTGVSAGYLGYSDVSAAATADYDTVNQSPLGMALGSTVGNYFRARNPNDSMWLLVYMPTSNYQNITIRYGTESSSTTSGDSAQIYAYSLDSGVTWNTAGLSVPSLVLGSTYLTFNAGQVTITDPAANNNPRLVFRITFKGHNTGTSGNNRFDNFSVTGDTLISSTGYGTPGQAGQLMYFWDFNTFAGTFTNPTFPYIAPDYFIHDSSKAKIHMGLFPGTSSSNPTYFDEVSTSTYTGTDGDTVNDTWAGVPALNPRSVVTNPGTGTVNPGIRCRNPQDSTYLYFYIPTVNYKNIVLKYSTESSSLTSGDSIQVFSYSVDSGITWRLSGLSEALDSAWISGMPTGTFGYRPVPITVSFTDPAANNCSKLVFRIHHVSRNTGTSGNNRYDNISVQGDSIFSPLPTITTTPTAYGPLCNSANSTIYVPFTTFGAVNGPYHVQISNSAGVFPTNFTSNIIDSFTGTLTSPITAIVPAGTLPGSVYRVRVVSAYPGIYGTDNGSNIVLTGVAAPISGPTTVCAAGATINLIESGSGTWSSSNTAVGTIGSATGVVTGLTPGNTTITFSVGVGCTTSTTITVNPIPSVITGLTNECLGVGATLSDATLSGTWTSGTTSVATIGGTTGTVNAIAVGNSTITYTLPVTGCYVTQPITVNSLPAAIGGSTPVCVGFGATLTDAASGGTWSSSLPAVASIGTSGTASGLSSGISTITYTSSVGCIATTPFTVNPNPASITGPSTGCVGSTISLNDATAFGAWSSSAPSVATVGSSTGIVTGTGIGTATISYTLSTGCQTSATVTINAASASITGTAVICAGSNSTLSCTSAGGTWSSSNTAVATVGTSVGTSTTVTGVVGGTVIITYTLPTGCIATKAMTINALPAPIAGQFTLYCLPSSTTLTDATAGGTWTSGTAATATIGSGSGLVNGVAPGTTIITYTLPTGCNVSVTETVYPTPAAITGSSNACVGTTTTYSDVTAFGAWSTTSSTISIGSGTGIVTGLSTGTAIVTYAVSTGCVITKSITVNPIPSAITGSTSVCAGLNDTLTNTGGGVWTSSEPFIASVGATSGIVTGIAAGNPTITYTLPTSCFSTSTITVNASPSIITGPSSVCTGMNINLNDLTTGGTWSSNNANASVGATTGVVNGVATGIDTIKYTLTDGCFVSKLMIINQTPGAITGTDFVCAGLTSTLFNSTSGGSWSSSVPALASIDATAGVVTGVAAGNPVISYTSPNGCYSTTVFTINPLPAPIGGVTSVYCIGSTALLSDFITGGSWSSSNPGVATIDVTGLVTGVAAGSAIISYVLPTGCLVTYVENITSTPAPITGVPTTCIATNTTFSDLTAFGAWSSSNPTIATVGSGTGVVTGVATGTTTITYELSPSCLITTNVTVNPDPTAISGTTNVCMGSATTLTDAGGGTWTSSIPALASVGATSGVVTGIVAGTVDISYTLPTGCVTSSSLTVNPLPLISGTTSICLGLPSPLVGNIPGGTWSSSNPAVATIGSLSGLVSAVTLGATTVTYTLPTGCIATSSVSVNPPPAAITGTLGVCQGSTTTLSGIGGGGWYSSNPVVASVGFGTGIVSGVSAGTATITYSLGTSCISLATVTVNALPATIAGTPVVCQEATGALSDITPSGTWSSSNTSVAIIGSSSGVVSGISGGNSTITYTISATGCIATTPVTVNPIAPITGINNVCTGLTVTLADSLSAGVWTSAATSVATIGSSTGVITGVTPGSAIISYTLPDGCISITAITVNMNPAPVTGNVNVCLGATYAFTDTTTGGLWSSSNPSVAIVGPGTGSLSGSTLGTATIYYSLSTGCKSALSVTVDPLPAAITGTTTVCAGLTSTLADASAGGTWSSSNLSLATVGTGSGIVTGITAGALTVTYMLPTGCTTTSSFTVKPLPTLYTISGGGSYCSGGTGLHIGLSGSDSLITYQLYVDTSMSGSAMPGTGSSLDFGLKTTAGTYTVMATNTVTGCSRTMTGSETITTIALPVAYNVTGGGGYCVGDTGLHVGLSHSDSGIHYQLYKGTSTVGTYIAGNGSPLDFGLLTPPGTYTVIGTNPLTTCNRNMNDSAVIFVDTLFTPTVTITRTPAGTINQGDSVVLTAHVTGGGTSVAYQWVKNVTYIAGATTSAYGSTGFNDQDSVTVLVTATSTCGATITPKSITLKIHNVGVQLVNFESSNLKLIPNPNSGLFTISGSLGIANDEVVSMEITNMLGQVIFKQNATTRNGSLNEQISLSNSLANGMYLLNVSSGTEHKVFHFVIEK